MTNRQQDYEGIDNKKEQEQEEETGIQITEIEGDLFTSADSLCHCVSEDLHMGKGIAVMFKSMFGRVNELKTQGATTGGLAVLQDNSRFIYYLVTKPKYSAKPTYQTLESSLIMMRDHMIIHQVSRLSMPLIGCGLDKLEWKRVKQLLRQVFNGTSNIMITVYKLPGSATTVSSSRQRAEKPIQSRKKNNYGGTNYNNNNNKKKNNNRKHNHDPKQE